jgi:hypothetical protein
MKRGLCTVVALAVLAIASAATGTPWYYSFQITGSLLNHPAQYSGIFTNAGDGTLEFTLNDAAWPDPADPGARFAYIWTTYFAGNYNGTTPGAEKWSGSILGTFTMSTSNAPTGYNGTLQGNINAKFTIRDLDADGILDDAEKYSIQYNMLDGRLSKSCAMPATGEMANKQGTGALNSNGFAFLYPPEINVLSGNGNLNLVACPSADEQSSWGSIKSLYR